MVGTIANRIDEQFEMFLCSKRVEGVTDSTLSGNVKVPDNYPTLRTLDRNIFGNTD